jgi:hypothetical protein
MEIFRDGGAKSSSSLGVESVEDENKAAQKNGPYLKPTEGALIDQVNDSLGGQSGSGSHDALASRSPCSDLLLRAPEYTNVADAQGVFGSTREFLASKQSFLAKQL